MQLPGRETCRWEAIAAIDCRGVSEWVSGKSNRGYVAQVTVDRWVSQYIKDDMERSRPASVPAKRKFYYSQLLLF